MFAKIVRLILLRELMRSGATGNALLWTAEDAVSFVLKGETPERPAPRPDAD